MLETRVPQVELALLELPAVEDCAVLLRESGEWVAYLVTRQPLTEDVLRNHLRSRVSPEVLPGAYVSLARMPVRPDGEIDEAALAKVPILDGGVIDRCQDLLLDIPGVRQVAVVVRPPSSPAARLHLSEAIPDWRAGVGTGPSETKTKVAASAPSVASRSDRKQAIASGGPLQAAENTPGTLPEALVAAAQRGREGDLVFLQRDGTELRRSYQWLLTEAERILGGLRAGGLSAGRKVILQLEQNEDILAAYWGCVLGGIVPVIAAVPPSYSQPNRGLEQLRHVWEILDRPPLMTSGQLSSDVASLGGAGSSEAVKVLTVEDLLGHEPDGEHWRCEPEDAVFFALTSGSTSAPKCVVLTHRNVLSRAAGANERCARTSDCIALNWLPLDHIGTISDWHVRCVLLGCRVIYAPKEYVISQPLRWLDLIDKHRVTHTWAPNFAYGLLNDLLEKSPERPWDLSSVEEFLTAGESVSAGVMERFAERLAPCGLKRSVLRPAFGMAEMASGVSYYLGSDAAPLRVRRYRRGSLSGDLEEASPGEVGAVGFVSLGPPIPGVSFRIVNDEGGVLPEETVGHFQVRGEPVSRGYYQAPEANRVFHDDGWFDTGDLGFLAEGELYLTGRAKESIVVNGANYSCGEIEEVVNSVEGVEASFSAACAVRGPNPEQEQLAIFFHTPLADDRQRRALLKEIRGRVTRRIGIKPDYLIPVGKEAIPKTAIGKLQRNQLSRRFESGEFVSVLREVDLLEGNSNTLPDSFHAKTWRRKRIAHRLPASPNGCTVVFSDRRELATRVCAAMDARGEFSVSVESADAFEVIAPGRFRLAPERPEHYRRLFQSLAAEGRRPDRILFLRRFAEPTATASHQDDRPDNDTAEWSALGFLVESLRTERDPGSPVRLIVATDDPRRIAEFDLDEMAILGWLRTISDHEAWLRCRHVGVSAETGDARAAMLLDEFDDPSGDFEVAYRDGDRWVAALQRLRLVETRIGRSLEADGTFREKMGTGSERSGRNAAESRCREVPVPISSPEADGTRSVPATFSCWVEPGHLPLSASEIRHSVLAAIHRGWTNVILGLDADHPAVRALCDDYPLASERLVAYVAAAPGWTPGELPDLEIADRFGVATRCEVRVIEGVEPGADGLISRESLLARAENRDAGPLAAPRNEWERRLTEIWKEVLGLSQVGPSDNLFELGGNSVLLVQLHSRIESAFGPRLSVVDMFKYPTIESLARFLGTAQDAAALPAPAIRGRQRAEVRRGRQSAARNSDVAVIGLGCRLPGAANAAEFWRNLCDGVESISFFREEQVVAAGVDPELARDPHYVRAAPVLEDVENFDADFFGYTAREAELMDPQQRLLLECAWEAMEDAGYRARNCPGSVGVFTSGVLNTYLVNYVVPSGAHLESDASGVMTLSSTGGFQVMVANDKDYLPTRISYKLNLRGPSVNIQTACSSSLVAIHMAAQSLLGGECDMALAGGVSVSVPQETGYLYQEGLLVSPDGHCRAFDADAQGTVFGNGAGLVLLKRLEDALADGDHIYAVIKGSAINNDGGEKAGYFAPSQDGQAAVVAEALAAAQVGADTISYVEAHGTGTALGDPIEIAGLSQGFRGDTDRKQFCAVGSVKTNIGHLQIASGVAGFIKAALALHHKQIPPSLHFKTPNPRIDFANSPFYVNAALTPWQEGPGPRRASVNSLGIGGANAHVILEEAPQPAPAQTGPDRPKHVLALSAKTPAALQALAARYAEGATLAETSLADLCFTANAGRESYAHRLGVVADSWPALRETLHRFARGETALGEIPTGQADTRPQIAFLFTGQGSEYFGMGRELFDVEPTFRHWIEECDRLLRPHLPESLKAVLYDDPEKEPLLHQTLYVQPALFAVQYALARLWQSWGIEPAALLGHSIGQYVAACLAGIFSLEDALRLVVHRAGLMQAAPAGKMAAVDAGEETVLAAIGDDCNHVSIAALNGPRQTVISGEAEAVDRVIARLTAEGVSARDLRTAGAFHSPLMEPVVDAFRRVAESVTFSPPQIPVIDLVRGSLGSEEMATADYWCRHLRDPVRFWQSVQALADRGCNGLLEVGPQPTLLALARQCLAKAEIARDEGAWLPSLRPRQSAWDTMLRSLAALFVRGADVDWAGLDRHWPRRRTSLPTYPFQRKRYWIERRRPSAGARRQDRTAAEIRPLLGRPVRSPALNDQLWESRLGLETLPILDAHRFCGMPILPGAFQLAMAVEAASRHAAPSGCTLENVSFAHAVVVPEGQDRNVQLILSAGDAPRREFRLVSRSWDEEEGDWTEHTSGRLAAEVEADAIPTDVREGRDRLTAGAGRKVSAEEFYALMRRHEVHLGAALRAVEAAWVGDNEVLVRVRAPKELDDAGASVRQAVLLDACVQVLGGTLEYPADLTLLPTAVGQFSWLRRPQSESLWCYVRLIPGETAPGERLADAWLFEPDGRPIARFMGLRYYEVPRQVLVQALGKEDLDWIYRPTWAPKPRPANGVPHRDAGTGTWLILADEGGFAARLSGLLEQHGGSCVQVRPGDAFHAGPDGVYQVDPGQPDHFHRLIEATRGRSPLGYRGVIYLWGLGGPKVQEASADLIQNQRLGCAGLLHLVQALDQAGSTDGLLLCLATRAAQPVHTHRLRIEQSGLWGLGRTIALEYPELKCLRVDLDLESDEGQASALLAELWGATPESEIAFRAGNRYAARLVRQPVNASAPPTVRADATYLISGGTGGLGLQVAGWLVDQGARHLVLLSRRGAASRESQNAIAGWQRRGVQVAVVRADVARWDELNAALAPLAESLPPVRGVVHIAGIRDDAMLRSQSWDRFETVMAAKVSGAVNLERWTKETPLDFFVAFSSIASLLGSPGQANYAAANAVLDALMHDRHARGLPGLAVNWGPWQDVGMAAALAESDQRALTRRGLAPLPAAAATRVLGALIEQRSPQLAAVTIDWRQYLTETGSAATASLVESLVREDEASASPGEVRSRLSEAPVEQRARLLLEHVQALVGGLLGGAQAEVELDQGFYELGLDSLSIMVLRNRLQAGLGITLPATLAFKFTNVRALADYLNDTLGFTRPPASEPARGEADRAQERTRQAAELADLSDEELADRLAEKLAAIRRNHGPT